MQISEPEHLGFSAGFYHLPMWHHENYSTPLRLSFLMWKMEIIVQGLLIRAWHTLSIQ